MSGWAKRCNLIFALAIVAALHPAARCTSIAGIDTAGTSSYPNGGLLFLDESESTGSSNMVVGVDDTNGYLYVGTNSIPARIEKFAVNEESGALEKVSTLTLESGEDAIFSGSFDFINGYGYFSTATSPARFIKVALGAGDAAPVHLGAVTFDSGENFGYSMGLDVASGYGYVGTSTDPTRVVKVALGSGDDVPERIGSLTLSSGESYTYSCSLDLAGGYGYFAAGTAPAKVIKVALGSGANLPTRVAAVTLNSGENYVIAGGIDPVRGQGWFSTAFGSLAIAQVSLGAGGDAPSRSGFLDLGPIVAASTVALDAASGFLYAIGNSTPSGMKVARLTLGSNDELPATLGSIAIPGANAQMEARLGASGHLYLVQNNPSGVRRFGVSQQGFLKGTKVTLAESAVVSACNFYAHEAAGNCRLALYDGSADPQLLWESGTIAISTTGFLSVPITSGTPNTLALGAGDYWLAYQVDTSKSVPSYSLGGSGEGFYIPRTFGAFPTALETDTATEPVLSAENWSMYLSYDLPDTTPPNATSITHGLSGLTNADSVDFSVDFDEPVQNFNDASDIVVTHSGTASTGVGISGSGDSYTVTISGISGNGSFNVAVNTGSDVEDLAGNPLASSVTSDDVLIDNTAPVVLFDSPAGAPVNSAGAVSWPLTISGANSTVNITSGDVTINHSGTAGGSINITDGTTVSPVIEVTGVTGNGSYSISIAAAIAVDLAGNTSAAAGPSASVTVDNTAPTVFIGSPSGSVFNSSGTIAFPVTISGADMVDLQSGDVVFYHSGTAGGSATVLNGTTASPTIEVTGVTGDGTFSIGVNAGISSDTAGNTSAAAIHLLSLEIDNTAPTVSIGTPTGSPVNSAGTASFPVTITGADSINLLPANVTLDQIGTSGGNISVLNGSSATPTVQVTGVSGDGSYTLSIAAGIASDTATNTSAAAGPSASVTVDNTAPGFSGLSVTPEEATVGEDVTISFVPDEPLPQDPTVTVNGNPATRTAKATGYTYAYTVQPTDANGPATIVVSGADSAGNTATLTSTTTLTISGGANVPLLAWPVLLALGAAAALSLRRRRSHSAA